MRESHCTAIPKIKAMATDTKMAMMTLKALSLFRRSLNVKVLSLAILMTARTNVAPRSSKTNDTVVDVGMPSVLNMSRITTSATMTARNTIITS